MSDTITMPLGSPVEYQGKTYTILTFRKLKAKDLVTSDLVDGEMRKSIAIFASVAGVPMGVIEELDLDDFKRNPSAPGKVGEPPGRTGGRRQRGYPHIDAVAAMARHLHTSIEQIEDMEIGWFDAYLASAGRILKAKNSAG